MTEIVLNKNYPQPSLSNAKQLWKLAFASDLIIYQFCLKSEGKTVLICGIHTMVKSFQQKLTFLRSQLILTCGQKLKHKARVPVPHTLAVSAC